MAELINKKNAGQSLAEVMIAIGIATIFIGGAALSASVILRLLGENRNLQGASFLAQGILDNAAVVADADWHRMDFYGGDALLSAPLKYRVDTSVTPFIIAAGTEDSEIGGVLYSRYFTAERVSRDGGGNIEPVYAPANEDPSTIKMTAFVEWRPGVGISTVRYLTRKGSEVAWQSDWSGGAGQLWPVTDVTKFDTEDAGINYTGTSGSLKLVGF